jgi:hypothetical protein
MPAARFLIRIVAITAAVIVGSNAPANGQWVETRQAGPFQIRSEFALSDDEGQRLVAEIGQLREDVETLLAIKSSDDPIQLSLFKSSATYRHHLAQRVPEAASRPALYVKGADMARVYVFKRRGYATDVRHECTHAILHNGLPFVPLWLDEGFAEYFEVAPGHRDSGSPYVRPLKRAILFGWKPDLVRLESLSDLPQMGADEYRESWAWVHFMLHGPGEVRQVLSDYLYDISQGETEVVLSDRLRAVDPHIERRMVAHIRNW